MVKGFREFISRGNVVDLAVAVVIGGAFALVIDAVVTGFVNPLVAAVFGEPDLTQVATFEINNAEFSIGLILDALLNFLMVAAAIYFFIVVPINKVRARKAQDAAEEAEEVVAEEIALLREIRDELRASRT
ncbi:large conductance mechanosensitive channel protein MscL [Phytoactinopolyspora halotolerans]|uniref:Large-conductance mechanosensitive channel n=1 Tax=Phytoactinopolyspora halotolerans TaxID=1981512 RepID=A0A6L9S7J8_9ACTN|nr:large conductance mechanosensitive channel protein MscL [Phytoactinopolyspora halotolerans]NEE01136.1 large conductance mechanosensitive channel protein MscL [Phytoactinopolyspora halotolerans]